MRVLWASATTDYGAYGWHLSQEFARHPGWRFRATRKANNYLRYPADLPWRSVRAEWRHADVVHLLDDFAVGRMIGARSRPYVIRYAGSAFRRDPKASLREMRRHKAIGLVATLDLWLSGPDELEWAPFIRNVDQLAAMRQRPEDGILRIAHSPTRRAVKSTDAFLAACERLGREVPTEVILVERQSWAECLRLKSTADIYFDQVKLGYGNNAVEAWSMGQPVVAGAADATLAEMHRRFPIPFVTATESTIYEGLRALVEPKARQHWGQLGMAHVRRFHDGPPVVAQLQDIYRRAVA